MKFSVKKNRTKLEFFFATGSHLDAGWSSAKVVDARCEGAKSSRWFLRYAICIT
jgi:hypothetical protein